MFSLESLIRPNIRTLEPYRCARDDFKVGILLDANENTHGPAVSNLTKEQKDLELNRYPDPHQQKLKSNLVNFRNLHANLNIKDYDNSKLKTDNLCLGVGSDESIDILIRCICTPGKDKMLTCPPTYGMYSICATVNDVQIETVPLRYPSFQVDNEGIIKKVTSDPSIKLIYLTSPGNPTATHLDVKSMLELADVLHKQWNGLLVVDEAYIDFTDSDTDGHSKSMSTLVNEKPNLVVMQTLSKAFGLAGIRLGVTFASTYLSHFLNAMKYPYNISSLTSSIALLATDPENGLKKMESYVDTIKNQRSVLLKKLQSIKGVGRNLGGLDANFILLEILDKQGMPSNETAHLLYNSLATESQVVVRFRGKELNCTGALRISIGKEDENDILYKMFKKKLEKLLE